MTTPCADRDGWLDGTAAPSVRAAFEVHLAGCPACREAVEGWRAFGADLRAAYASLHEAPHPAQAARLVARAEAPGGPGWPRAWRWSAALGVAAAATLALLLAWPAPEVALAPTLLSARGARLEGGVAETAAGGRAVVRLGDDTVGLGADTRVLVTRATRRATRLSLERGVLAASVDPSRGARRFEVETRQGLVRVTGTVFRVRVGDAALVVEVARGRVEVLPASGPALAVGEGERLEVAGGEARRAAAGSADFDELREPPPAATVEAAGAPDAGPTGAPAGEADAGLSVAAPRIPSRVAAAPALRDWRARAARGECALVTAEVERHLQRAPGDERAWLVLGDCRRRLGDTPGAVTAYGRAARERGPEAARGLLLAASLWHDELGEPARAVPLLEAYVARRPETPALEAAALVRLARAHAALGRRGEARALLERVVRRFPDTPAAAEAVHLRQDL